MNAWICALLILGSGAVGGIVNALLTDNGFVLPQRRSGIWCPGALTNVLIGAFAAFSSWSFYGSGASIDLTAASTREVISLRFSALAGAFLVGVAGAKWITSEVDKRLLKESVKVAASGRVLSSRQSEEVVEGSPLQVLHNVREACQLCQDARPAGTPA